METSAPRCLVVGVQPKIRRLLLYRRRFPPEPSLSQGQPCSGFLCPPSSGFLPAALLEFFLEHLFLSSSPLPPGFCQCQIHRQIQEGRVGGGKKGGKGRDDPPNVRFRQCQSGYFLSV